MSATNVLKLHATYEAGGKYYVVEERTSDHEVMDRIAEAISYDEQEAKRLAAGLMQAVALLHSKDIVHRNITPENVVLSSDAVDAVVKLTNFTLAKQLPPPLSSSPQIRVTTPPESLDSTALMSRVEKAGDVWAVGILLHMLLVGKSPSLPQGGGGEVESEEVKEVKEVELREEDGWSAVSQEAKDLVRGLLRFDPLARLTITQALAHPWLSEHLIQSSESTLSLSWEEIAEVAEEKEEVFVAPSSSSEEGLLVIAPITAVEPEAVLEEQNSQSLEEARRKLRRSYIIKKFQRAIFSLIFIDRVKRCVAMTKHIQAKTIKGRGEDKEEQEEEEKKDEIKEEKKEMKGEKEVEKVDDDDDDDINDGCYYEDWNFDPILSYSSYVTSVFSSFYATFTKPVKE